MNELGLARLGLCTGAALRRERAWLLAGRVAAPLLSCSGGRGRSRAAKRKQSNRTNAHRIRRNPTLSSRRGPRGAVMLHGGRGGEGRGGEGRGGEGRGGEGRGEEGCGVPAVEGALSRCEGAQGGMVLLPSANSGCLSWR